MNKKLNLFEKYVLMEEAPKKKQKPVEEKEVVPDSIDTNNSDDVETDDFDDEPEEPGLKVPQRRRSIKTDDFDTDDDIEDVPDELDMDDVDDIETDEDISDEDMELVPDEPDLDTGGDVETSDEGDTETNEELENLANDTDGTPEDGNDEDNLNMDDEDTGDNGDIEPNLDDDGTESDSGTTDDGDGTDIKNNADNQLKYSLYINMIKLSEAIRNYQDKLYSKNEFSTISADTIKIVSEKLKEIDSALTEYMIYKYTDNSYPESLVFYNQAVSSIGLLFEVLNTKEIPDDIKKVVKTKKKQ